MTSMMNTFGRWLWEIFPPAVMAAGDGDQVSVGAVGTIIGAIFAGIGLVAGKIWGKKEASVTKVRPLPLPVELREKLATKDDLHDVEEQLGSWIGRVERAMTDERQTVREEQGKLHARMDNFGEKLSDLVGEVRQMNANVGRLIDRKLDGK